MTITDLVDGRQIAARVNKRLNVENARVAAEIASKLVLAYLKKYETSATATQSIDMLKGLQLSAMCKNYCWTREVQAQVTEILRQKNWSVTFKDFTCAHLAPVPEPASS
jgi:predicted ATP-dependent serine protease